MATFGKYNLSPKLIEVAGKNLAPEHSNKLALDRQEDMFSCTEGPSQEFSSL